MSETVDWINIFCFAIWVGGFISLYNQLFPSSNSNLEYVHQESQLSHEFCFSLSIYRFLEIIDSSSILYMPSIGLKKSCFGNFQKLTFAYFSSN